VGPLTHPPKKTKTKITKIEKVCQMSPTIAGGGVGVKHPCCGLVFLEGWLGGGGGRGGGGGGVGGGGWWGGGGGGGVVGGCVGVCLFVGGGPRGELQTSQRNFPQSRNNKQIKNKN